MTDPGGYNYGYIPQIDFGWLSRAWDLFRARAAFWIGAIFLFGLCALLIGLPIAFATGYAQIFTNMYGPILRHQTTPPPALLNPLTTYGSSLLFSVITYSLMYVLLGGLYSLALRQIRGEGVEIGGLFDGFQQFLPLAVAGFIVTLGVLLGTYLCLLPGLILQGLFMFTPLLIVDRKMGPLQALGESVNLLKGQWIMAALFYFVAQLIASLGVLACGVGTLVTYPLFLISIAVGYTAFTQPASATIGYDAPQPGVWPPPPTVGQVPPQNWGPPPSQTPPEQAPLPRTSLSGEALDNAPEDEPPAAR